MRPWCRLGLLIVVAMMLLGVSAAVMPASAHGTDHPRRATSWFSRPSVTSQTTAATLV